MKRLAVAVLTMCLVLGGVLLTSPAAYAADGAHGRVTQADGTTPIANVSVEFLDGQSTYSHTDTNGDFVIDVSPGVYTVNISFSGYATWTKTGVVVSGDGSVEVNAALEAESTVTGTIRDYDGDLMGDDDDVVVTVFGGESGRQVLGQVFTEDDGTYVVSALPAGDVRVFAQQVFGSELQTQWYVAGHNEATATLLSVPGPGGTAVADIVLPLGAKIQGSVVDPIGSPVSLDVNITGSGVDDASETSSGGDGLYEVAGLYPQDYTVALLDSYGLFTLPAPRTVTAVVGTPATEDFVVTPALVDETEFVDEVALLSGPTTVEPGETYTWKIDMAGDTSVYAILYSDPVYLGAAERNLDGTATLTLTIPADIPLGDHKLTFSGMDFTRGEAGPRAHAPVLADHGGRSARRAHGPARRRAHTTGSDAR